MHDPETLAFALGPFLDIWHVDPGDDYNTHCDMSSPRRAWRWHAHHWRIRAPFLIDIRRRLLTRCAWCGGRDAKRDRVNHSNGGRRRGPWWKGEIGLFHGDCIGIRSAHRTCLCDDPLTSHSDHGWCAFCGKFRPYGLTPERINRAKTLASIPTGERKAVAR